MSEKKIRVNISENFMECGSEEIPSEDYLKRDDVYYDIRNNMLAYNTNFSDLTWYYNYLRSNANFASRNPKGYPGYLLNLGYVPVVFLPSCCANRAVSMMNKLDVIKLPYIKTAAYSWVVPRPNMGTLDAWVSKLDIERVLGIPITEVTSCEVVRRIYE